MIDSIDIKRFRNLEDLSISSLASVNLITGQNNAGKSTLLEAIALFVTKCDLGIIVQLLEERGENFRQAPNSKNSAEGNIKAISSLFTNRIFGFGVNDIISIGTVDNSLSGSQNSSEKSISLRFVKYFDEVFKQPDESVIRRKRTVKENYPDNQLIDYKLGIEVRVGINSYIWNLDDERFGNRTRFKSVGVIDNYQFIRSGNIDREINGKLWDNITLTEKEQYVIEALKIIEPLVERIAFIEDGTRSRSSVIKLSNNSVIFPLRSMGDGINRVLTIILALVNSENGYLLIDEFENGLHYSIQKKLWEIIFNLAQRLHVQVFVTTHSNDCISGFEKILNSRFNNTDGKLIRLDNINGKIRYIEFNKYELKIANDQHIETR